VAITASVGIKGFIQSLGVGRVEIESTLITAAIAQPTNLVVVLASGDNTISFPASTQGVIITLPSASIRTKILKGAAGDTGILIASSGQGGTMLLRLAATVTSFIINCSGTDAGLLTEFQFF